MIVIAFLALAVAVTLMVFWRRVPYLQAIIPTPPMPPVRLQNLKTVLIVGLVLRLPLMSQSFWYDEAFTHLITTLSGSQLWPAIRADVHPPPYYAFMWVWSRIAGNSEIALRLPSLVFGLLMIMLAYRLALAIKLTQSTSLIAAALVAVTPVTIYYSTEARSYAMLTCAVLGALIAVFEDRPLLFVFSVVAVAWLHNLGLLYVPVLVLAALLYNWQHVRIFSYQVGEWLCRGEMPPNTWIESPAPQPRQKWCVASATAIFAASIWLPLTLVQTSAISDGFWITFDTGTPFQSLAFNLMYVPTNAILLVLLPYIAGLTGCVWVARRWLQQVWPLALVLAGVPLIFVAVSLIWHPVYLPRALLPINVLALIPLAYTLHRHWKPLAAVAAYLLPATLITFFFSVNLIRPDFRGMAQSCQGADAMYYTAVDTAITIAPYSDLPALAWGGGADRGKTFKADQMPLFGLSEGDITEFAGKTVCVVYIYTPRTLEPERQLVKRLFNNYLGKGTLYTVDSELEVDVYLLGVTEQPNG